MRVYKSNLVHRLMIVRGHLYAIDRMIQRNEYCMYISQQIRAVNGALRKINEKVLEYHLKNCCRNIKQPLNAENNIVQILKVFSRWN